MKTITTCELTPANKDLSSLMRKSIYLMISAIVCWAFAVTSADAATYYIDAINGNDSYAGTSGAPWQTIAKAKNMVQGGDTVLLRNGNYGDFTDARITTGTSWIIYKADAGHTPVLGHVVIGSGGSNAYIELDGLSITAQLKLNGDYVNVKNCDVQGGNWNDMVIYGDYSASLSEHVTVENCQAHYGWRGIMCGGSYWTVRNNRVYSIAEDGIRGGFSNTLIERNEIWDNSPYYHPQYMGNPGGSLDIHNDPISWYSATPQQNILIIGNKIHSSRVVGGGAIFISANGGPWTNIRVENNLIYGINGNNLLVGAGGGDLHFNNNTLNAFDNPNPGNLHIAGAKEFHNNILSNVNFQESLPETQSNNIFGHTPTGLTPDASSLLLSQAQFEALFVNYNGNDYTLAPGSAAINFGNPNYAPATDLLGNTRDSTPDAGCYEYVASNPNNHAPVLEAIGNKPVSENSLLTFTISATDADGDTISYSAQVLPSGATFASRTFSWTPNYNQANTYQVTFRASDGQASDSETITITVSNTNRPPVLAAIGNKPNSSEGVLLSFTVSATDPDGDTLTYSATNLPSGTTFANRAFNWTPNYNQDGTYNNVTFTVSDSQSEDSEAITITVANVNRASVLATIGDKSAYVNELLSFTISATDPDGDTVIYSAQNLPTGATFANRTFNWTPSSSQVGTHQVIFIASDGSLQDSETITITVLPADTTASQVTNLSPAANSIQVPLNTLIALDITDSGKGVDAASVSITLDGSVIYTGDTTSYTSSSGRCSRTGTPADYTYIYQSNAIFDYDQTINVTVNASDLASNEMNPYSYSFQTEMRSFSKNKSVNSDTTSIGRASPATIRDNSGNIYAVWHSGTADARDIYLAKLPAGQVNFSGSIQITTNSSDQCNPAIAIDTANKLHLVWQDNRSGNWDIYGSTSTDGVNWSTQRRISDSNNNEINPAIIIDKSSPQKAYVAWQDDRAGDQEIFIASSSDSFATNTVTRVTTNTANQTEPALTVTAANVVYVVWTDQRSGSSDIYAAGSNSGPWSNVPVVTKSGNQTSPAIAAESAGSIVNLLWVDDSSGNRDIFYASSNGLTGTTLNGTNIIDDASGKEQIEPTIAVTGTGSALKVFACWQDKRNISGTSSDSDLYFVQTNSGSGTNIFVGDDSANSNQTGPAIAIDAYSYPYIVWVDDRNSRTDIYYAASTFISSSALASSSVTTSAGVTIGTDPATITSIDDVSIIVPVGGVSCTVTMSIFKVNNPSNLPVNTLSPPYDFCPSGITFDQPVTITIPYAVSASNQSATARWYNTLTGQLSQQGITDTQNLTISPTLRALQFQTTHFTQFVVVEAIAGSSGGGGGGGGCSIGAKANPADFFLPYAGLGVVMVAIRRHDVKKHHGHNRSQ